MLVIAPQYVDAFELDYSCRPGLSCTGADPVTNLSDTPPHSIGAQYHGFGRGVKINFETHTLDLTQATYIDLRFTYANATSSSTTAGYTMGFWAGITPPTMSTRDDVYATALEGFPQKLGDPSIDDGTIPTTGSGTLDVDIIGDMNGNAGDDAETASSVTSPQSITVFIYGHESTGVDYLADFTDFFLLTDAPTWSCGTINPPAASVANDVFGATQGTEPGIPFFIEEESLIGWYTHTGDPNGAISASPGSVCQTPLGLYVKESGLGNAGWTLK